MANTQIADLLLNFDLGLMVETVEPKQPDSNPAEAEQAESKYPKTKRPKTERPKTERPKTERLSVLNGLRKYATEHVLLVGRPGSGKSTALVRLLLEEAKEAKSSQSPLFKGDAAGRETKNLGDNSSFLGSAWRRKTGGSASSTHLPEAEPPYPDSQVEPGNQSFTKGLIPILVELRYYQTSALEKIFAALLSLRYNCRMAQHL